MSSNKIIKWERRRGSFKSVTFMNWIRLLLRSVRDEEGVLLNNLTLVIDNAPVHSHAEDIFAEEEFRGAHLLRLSPYSSPLNPIEIIWSIWKTAMKSRLSDTFTELMRGPANNLNLTQNEYRLRYLEDIIDNTVHVITPAACLRSYNHIQRHYMTCIERNDLQVGT